MEKLSIDEFVKRTSNGHIFTTEFVKRTTGELRVMNCRRGVSKGVKGVGMSYDPAAKALLTVFDMQKGAFRMINLEDLRALRLDGKKYTWNHKDACFEEQPE